MELVGILSGSWTSFILSGTLSGDFLNKFAEVRVDDLDSKCLIFC